MITCRNGHTFEYSDDLKVIQGLGVYGVYCPSCDIDCWSLNQCKQKVKERWRKEHNE